MVLKALLRPLSVLLARARPAPPVGDADRVLAETREFYVALGEDGTVLAWNGAAADLFGHPVASALGRPVEELIVPPAHRAAHRAGVQHYLQTGSGRGVGGAVEVEALRADGSLVPVELTIWAQQTATGVVFHALGHDLSARRQRDRALHLLAEHRQGLLLTDSPTAARELLCRTVREAAGCQGVYLYEPDDDGLRLTAQSLDRADPGPAFLALHEELLTRLSVPGTEEVRLDHDDLGPGRAGHALRATGLQSFVVRPLRSGTVLVGGMVLGWVADGPTSTASGPLLELLASEAVLVFDRLAVQERLRFAARTDPLTGLWNRREYEVRAAEAVERAHAEATPLALLVLDLDRFKAYNDLHGHPAGDALLVKAARRWQEALPGEGLARTGGDEFALVLPGADAQQAARTAQALQAATPAAVGLTVGVALLQPGDVAEDLLCRADADLYARKRAREPATG